MNYGHDEGDEYDFSPARVMTASKSLTMVRDRRLTAHPVHRPSGHTNCTGIDPDQNQTGIQCVCCEGHAAPYKGLINILARSFSIALDCKYATDQMHFGGHARIHVVRPRFPLEIGLLDFRYSTDLIHIGYQQSLAYFNQKMH